MAFCKEWVLGTKQGGTAGVVHLSLIEGQMLFYCFDPPSKSQTNHFILKRRSKS